MFDIHKASQNLEDLDIHLEYEGMKIDVQWFRVAFFSGDWFIGRHNHSFFELHLIKEGICGVRLDDGCFTTSAGEFYINAPGVFHEQFPVNSSNTREYCLCLSITWDKDDNTEAGALFHILNDTGCRIFKDNHSLVQLFDMALEEAFYKRTGFFNKIRSIASLLIINTAQILSAMKDSGYKVPLKSNSGDYRFNQIENFITDNISGTVTVKQISDYMHLSEKQITRIVKQNAGICTKDFIIRNKLMAAADLIKNSSLAISEISDRLGFSSVYYFSQYFRKFYGHPPSVVRKNMHDVRKH